jgi:hypothetical protein
MKKYIKRNLALDFSASNWCPINKRENNIKKKNKIGLKGNKNET